MQDKSSLIHLSSDMHDVQSGDQLIYSMHYQSHRLQPVRNVFMAFPSIIRIHEGQKCLQWQDKTLTVDNGVWLMSAANDYLTFVNSPAQAPRFYSQQLSFALAPNAETLAINHRRSRLLIGDSTHPSCSETPLLSANHTLNYFFDLLFNLLNMGLCQSSQAHIIQSFYSQLAHLGVLHKMFPNTAKLTYTEKVSRYLMLNPEHQHSIEQTSSQFSMSKATLSRRLKEEGQSYRNILRNIRMTHALSILQKDPHDCHIEKNCGYDSHLRFGQAFKHQFGLTPAQYAKSVWQKG